MVIPKWLLPSMGVVGLVSLAPAASAATVYYVDKNNTSCSNSGPGTAMQPFCSIATAAGKVNPGDTVNVMAGTYTESVTLTRSGASGSPITFQTVGGTVTLTGKTYGFNLSGVQYVTIDGFTITSTTSDGIRVTLSPAGAKLSNNHIQGAQGRGIYVTNSSGITLSDNIVEGSVGHGIYMTYDTDFHIIDGSVTRSGQPATNLTKKGIYIYGSSASTIGCDPSNLSCKAGTSTEVFDNSDIGIYLVEGTNGVTVKGTLTHGNARQYERIAAGIETRSDGNIIEANVGHHNEDSAINMRYGGSNTLVLNNVAYSSGTNDTDGDHGIDVLESPGVTIIGNSVFDNVTCGINVEGNSPGPIIKNNISVDNGLDVLTRPDGTTRKRGNICVGGSSMPAKNSDVDYNIVFFTQGDGTKDTYLWRSTYYKTLVALRTAAPGAEGQGIESSPKWVNPASGDFHLTTGSPAIDSGTPVSGWTVDANGCPRGTPPDRGAYEFPGC